MQIPYKSVILPCNLCLASGLEDPASVTVVVEAAAAAAIGPDEAVAVDEGDARFRVELFVTAVAAVGVVAAAVGVVAAAVELVECFLLSCADLRMILFKDSFSSRMALLEDVAAVEGVVVGGFLSGLFKEKFFLMPQMGSKCLTWRERREKMKLAKIAGNHT